MAKLTYMQGRKRWGRPQAMVWSNNPGYRHNGVLVPDGDEGDDFIVITDHNRSAISVTNQRLESRTRMINGTMRSYHTADKIALSTSWALLPSRSHTEAAVWDKVTGKLVAPQGCEYTVDGGAGAVAMMEWYEDHPGPFYVFLAYDRYDKFVNDPYSHLSEYSDVRHMYFSSFDFSIEKRGNGTDDWWNVGVALEEV